MLSSVLSKTRRFPKFLLPVAQARNFSLRCSGCSEEVNGIQKLVFSCPNSSKLPGVDHVLTPDVNLMKSNTTSNNESALKEDSNPFIRFRSLTYPYRTAMDRGMSDAQYVKMVQDLDKALEEIDGTGFRETPMYWHQPLNSFIKVEVDNVAQSHKARHLFNAMLYLLAHKNTTEGAELEQLSKRRLAVASCGNAGLAAATIAAAAKWPIDVCIPADANAVVVARLKEVGATVHMIGRDGTPLETVVGSISTEGSGDPTVTAFRNLVEKGSIPLSVQGPECWAAVEGGQFMAWEVASALARDFPDVNKLGNVYTQVGGGAMGGGLMQGFQRVVSGDLDGFSTQKITDLPTLKCVQPEGNNPLGRAFAKMSEAKVQSNVAAQNRNDYMFPWENPHSVAYGILDDETYDWVTLCNSMSKTNGSVITVNDILVNQAKSIAEYGLGVDVCHTGAAGLAGLLVDKDTSKHPNLVIFSGLDRTKPRQAQKTVGKSSSRASSLSSSRSTRYSSSMVGMNRPVASYSSDSGMKMQSASFSTTPAPTTWNVKGIEYRQLESTFDPEVLFEFNKTHGSTPLNFIPDGPVREHLNKIKTGETTVWGAFDGDKLAGFITGEVGGGYWIETGPGRDATCFINEFVVDPSCRGKGIGKTLTRMSIDSDIGIFGIKSEITEMYTTVHVDNIASRTAFIQGGYHESITYDDKMRDRSTTVLKKQSGRAAMMTRENRKMRVVGLQSGNAVDGIDVGVFDFEPLKRDPNDPRALAAPLKYNTLANKTYSFTAEERNFVLGLRALDREDGVEYAEGNYRLGEMFAKAVNSCLEENGIDKKSVHLIGTHGQSICGHPHWEFGDLSVIAQQTGITTAGDFRPADVAAGGNGTPCTCTYDSIMLRPDAGAEQWRIAINIGGTSSVTFCPPWPEKGQPSLTPLGLDPGLGVFFMDLTVAQIDPSLAYDDDGKIARTGKVHEGLLAEFLTYKYYQQKNLPIGVGAEDFPVTLWEEWRARAQELGVSDLDLLTTFTELTAKQIAMACSRFGGEHIVNGATDDVLLRGGVAMNSYFVERLQANMSIQLNTEIKDIKSLAHVNLNEESWENAMYAMLGYLCYNNMYNFVPSCTGATRSVVGGRIAPGENFLSVSLLN